METISAIAQAGADVNAVSDWFGTPLCLAAIRRDLAAVEFMIDHNASVNKDCDEIGSAAHAACAGGDLAVIRALHAAGADWADSKRIRVSALCHLSRLFRTGRPLVVYHKPSSSKCQAQSPGAVAVRFRHGEAVDFCLGLAKGLDVHETWEITSYVSSYGVMMVLEVGVFPLQPLGTKMSLLSLAMSTLDVRTAELLLDHGARDNLLDPVGRGALAHALDATRLPTTNTADLDSCVKLLVRHGVDINGLRSPGGWNAYAAERFVETWIRDYVSGDLLLFPTVYASVNNHPKPQPEGTPALIYTIRRMSDFNSLSHCIDVLCKNGASPDLRDENGRLALRVARQCLKGEQRIQVERILLSHSSMRPVETEVGPTG